MPEDEGTHPVPISQTSVEQDPRPTTASDGASTSDVAVEQTKTVGRETRQASRQVADTASDQAQAVASEAGAQVRNLLHEVRTQLLDQAAAQQDSVAAWLHSVADELDAMGRPTPDSVRAGGDSPGTAAQVVQQTSARIGGLATWLDQHQPGDALQEVGQFARRRPGAFLLLAVGAGLLAGRLTRGLTAQPSSETTGQPSSLPEARTRTPGDVPVEWAGSPTDLTDSLERVPASVPEHGPAPMQGS